MKLNASLYGSSLDEELKTKQDRNIITSLFDVNNLKEGWRAVLKKREFNKRLWILLLIAAFELEIFMDNGKRGSSYLYFRRQLGWGEVEFSRSVF